MNTQHEQFLVIHPKNELVSKHIKRYYFHSSSNFDFYKNVIYYPHYLTTLNIYKDIQVKLNEFGRTYLPKKSKRFSIIYTINKKTSKEVRLRGKFEKIGITFNPLGINHFMDHPLSEVISNNICYFDYFGEELHEISEKVFNENDIQKKRDLLDDFFSNQFSGFNDSRIIEAAKHISNSDDTMKTQDLAKTLNVSRETLLRIFKKHLCYSVEEFKLVVRFRRALEYYEEREIKPKLTNLAMDCQYYDQSDFVKHFKKVTGSSPRHFFSSLRNIGNSGTYWTIMD